MNFCSLYLFQLFVYQVFGAQDLTTNISLLIVMGLLVNGPYALITTAVSTELGTHKSLRGSARALATVTAIIDGTGSIGNQSLRDFFFPNNNFIPQLFRFSYSIVYRFVKFDCYRFVYRFIIDSHWFLIRFTILIDCVSIYNRFLSF